MSSIKTATILTNTAVTSEICSPSNVFTPTIAAKVSSTSTCSTSFCFENAIILSGSSGCSSLSNSPTSSTSTTGSLPSPTPASKVLDDTFSSTAVNGEYEEQVLKCLPQNSLLAKFKLSEGNAIKKENDILNGQSQMLDDFSTDFSVHHNSRHHHVQQFQSQYQQQHMVHHSMQSLNTDDARTLQLAVELSMMGLNDQMIVQNSQLQQLRFQATENQFPQCNSAYQMNTLSKTLLPTRNTTVLTNPKYTSNQSSSGHFNASNYLNPSTCLTISEERAKKSQNMTECVPVPSSEHVAEIVGRQGCKIKALRAKTNTYIKTPVRNEEPVFVVTGRKEDVAKAKREILSAAEHFTLIRATRRAGDGNGTHNGMAGVGCIPKNSLSAGNGIQGQVTIQVRVPYRVVGLVVGPKGNTIKHIQHETQTYIVTPSRDKEPIFEVTGLPDNVQAARKHIEAHIATRTGGETVAIGQEDNKDVPKIVTSSINRESIPRRAALQPASMFTTPSSQHTVGSTVHDELSLPNMLASPLPILQIVPKINALIPSATSSGETMSLESTPHRNSDESLQAIHTIDKIVNDDIHVELLSTIYKTGIESAFESLQQSVGEVVSQLHGVETNSKKTPGNTLTSLSSSSGHLTEFPLTNSTEIDIKPSVASSSHPINQIHLNGLMNFHMTTNKADYSNHIIKTSSGFESDLDQQAANIQQLASFMTNGGPVRNVSSNTILRNLKSNINEISNGANNVSALTRSCSSASSASASSSKSLSQSNNNTTSTAAFWKRVSLGDSTEIDEGIGESPNIWKLPKKLAVVTSSYCPTSISPTDQEYLNYNHFRNKPIIIHGPMEHNGKTKIKRDCCICHEKEMVAALIPCGHKMFCVDCANNICSGKEPTCPFCCMRVYQAVKILN
uniref:RING-type domain-containing protein n=1 Tax=Glossina morsitans morsitans TaxID=37546 RepID=A0A1B0GBN2_GLOMM